MLIRIIALYGLLGGLIVAAPMIWFMLSLPRGTMPDGSVVAGYLTMIVALTAVFLGVKRYRDHALGGVIRFVPALLVGLGISTVASIIYCIGWEVWQAYSGFDFASSWSKTMVESARARGASPAELQQAMADAETFARNYANPLWRLPMVFIEMFPVGVLISLITAAVLRNPRVLPARAPA